MPLIRRNHPLPHNSAEDPQSVIDAMAYAKEVKAEYKELMRGYRKELYNFIGGSLACYRIFLDDLTAQEALLKQDNILRLHEKPPLDETSRLLLYYLTDARSEPERNIAGKYARVINFLDKQGVENDAAAEYVEKEGGIEKILKKARKVRALKAAERTTKYESSGGSDHEETDDADDASSSDAADDLFNPEVDISARVGSETLERVWTEIPMNEVFYLECWKAGSIGRNGILIRGRLYDPETE